MQDRKIPTLDGWRAVAALLVVLAHGLPRTSPLSPLRVFGVHGVFIFFALSGLLITSRMLDEIEREGRVDLRAFYLRRVFRILPPAFAYLLFLFLAGAIGVMTMPPAKEFLTSAFFFQNYTPPFPGRTHYATHFWSLAVEEHFYLLWPALLVMLGVPRARKWVPAIAFAVGLWRLADATFHIAFPSADPVFNLHRTDRVFDGLLWGCYLALSLRNARVRELLTRALKPWVWGAVAVAFVVDVYRGGLFTQSIEVLLIPLLLAGTVLHPNAWVGRVLELSPLRWLGKLSYSIYLWQAVLFVGAYFEPSPLQKFPVNVILLIAAAAASHYWLEEPALRLGRRIARSLRPPRPAVPAPVSIA